MAIDYKVLGIQKPGTDEPQYLKYYPRPTSAQRVEIEELAEEISYSTTLTDVEVEGVIKALIKQMQLHIANGRIVALGKFGSFRITFHAAGSATPEEVKASDIKKVNLRFCPGTGLSKALDLRNLKFRSIEAGSGADAGGAEEPELP